MKKQSFPVKEEHHKKYKKEKKLAEVPSDAEEEDTKPTEQNPWKNEVFKPGDMSSSLVDESSFVITFAKYREPYIKSIWEELTNELKQQHGIDTSLDLRQGRMEVKTTKKTWDPYAILKARDLLKLLSRGMNIGPALDIMKDGVDCDIIKIGGFTRTQEKFKKRRQRLVGPNGATQKAIELLTGCSVLVMGTTVAAVGPVQGLEYVRSIVEECMKNIHPVYNIKELMIRKEISKDPTLANEDWTRFLPKYKKTNTNKLKSATNTTTKKKPKREPKKEYTPFPPAPLERQVDKKMASGEYALKDAPRTSKAHGKSASSDVLNSFVPPKEKKFTTSNTTTTSTHKVDKKTIQNIQSNISKSQNTENTKKRKQPEGDLADYLLVPKKKFKA